MTAHEIHALSGAYAMDALDDLERARFEAHLAECAECREEVASLADAAATLSATTETAPPPALRAAVLSEIKKIRPLPPETAATAIVRRRPRWVGVVSAAAAAAAFFGGGAVVWQQTHDTVRTNPAEAVIQARDAQKVTVDLPGGASATVYRSTALGKAALVTRHMKAAPSGHVYQLWFQRGGRMVPAGLMTSPGDQVLLLKGRLDDATGAGITVEPSGGSETPTTAPVVLFDFQQAT